MLEGRRKSVEPMAQRLGDVHYQALHHFVAVSPWDWRPVRRRLAERLVAALGPPVWAVDDTGFPRTVSVRWGWSASTRARWARQPTGSWACRSTPSPSRPAARWTGGCLCPGAGTRTWAGPLRGPQLRRLAPRRHPGLGRPRLSHPGAAAPPETAASACRCGCSWASCKLCSPAGPAPVPSASDLRHVGSATEDEPTRRPDRALLGGDEFAAP